MIRANALEDNFNLYYYPQWLWNLLVRVQIGRWVPGRVGAAIWRTMIREGEPYPPMGDATRSALAEFYAPDNKALGTWLGRDLSSWSTVRAVPVDRAPKPLLEGDAGLPTR